MRRAANRSDALLKHLGRAGRAALANFSLLVRRRPWLSTLAIVALATMVGPGGSSRAGDHPEPDCKTPAVYLELKRLESEIAKGAEVIARADQLRWDDARRLEHCIEAHTPEEKRAGIGETPIVPKECAEEVREKRKSDSAADKARAAQALLTTRQSELYRLPECRKEPQTPPQPKPDPKPDPKPIPPKRGIKPLKSVSPTYRVSYCVPCLGLAQQLNAVVDQYTEARNRGDPGQAALQTQMRQLSKDLDDCERQCPANPDAARAGDPAPPKHPEKPKKKGLLDQVLSHVSIGVGVGVGVGGRHGSRGGEDSKGSSPRD